MSHHIVEINELHYAYPDGTKALNGISLRVPHGESVAVVGANGAGKSTLLLHLNGCLLPRTGTVRIGEDLLAKATLASVRRSVGMVFQNPDDQLFMPTVFDDVAFGPLNLGLPTDEVVSRAKEALAIVGAGHLENRPPYKLSSGQKRCVSIAAVLSMSPDVLVMDEPSSNLDPKSRRGLIELLNTFKHTKIIATHDLDLALDVCERTVVLKHGRIIADGPTLALMNEAKLLEESHLERPLRLQGCPRCGSQRTRDVGTVTVSSSATDREGFRAS